MVTIVNREMAKEQIGTRLAADEFERFDEYREERGIGKSDAARRLIVSALDGEDIHDRLDDVREELRDERDERVRLETRVDLLEDEVDGLEDKVESARREARQWQARYNEATGKLKVHHSEKDDGSVLSRLRDLLP